MSLKAVTRQLEDVPPGGLYFWGYRYTTRDPFTGSSVTDTLELKTAEGIGLGSSTDEVELPMARPPSSSPAAWMSSHQLGM